ncbi:MAG: hypothetical protein KY469_21165 [Actinobacteria bacterium]|nr:hypothetical protein [Actinomycetota bacterium]
MSGIELLGELPDPQREALEVALLRREGTGPPAGGADRRLEFRARVPGRGVRAFDLTRPASG